MADSRVGAGTIQDGHVTTFSASKKQGNAKKKSKDSGVP